MQSAFEAWCAHQQQIGRLRHLASAKVYRAMWRALADWCAGQLGATATALQALDGTLLQRYFDSRSGMAGPGHALTVRYRLRLLRLVARVQAHSLVRHDSLGAAGVSGLPGLSLANRRGAAALAWSELSLAAGPSTAGSDAPASLGAALADQLIRRLSGDAAATGPTRWQDQRDRCALALALGAGLGPGDLRALKLADVLAPASAAADPHGLPARRPGLPLDNTCAWWLCVPANGNAPAYRAPVAAWAAVLLQQWLASRVLSGLSGLSGLPGQMLFPSTRSGKPWGKVAQYGSVRKALAAAGLPDGPGGSFRLRHTFALRQLVHGHPADTVASWLGVSDPQVMQRYRQALGAALIDHAAHGEHGRLATQAGAEHRVDRPGAWPV